MDAQSAFTNGFIDSVVDDEHSGALTNSVQPRTVDLKEAKEKVRVWFDRHTPHKPQLSRPVPGDDHTSAVAPAHEQDKTPMDTGRTAPSALPKEPQIPQDDPATSESAGIPIAQLQKRLGLLMPAKRSN